MAPENIPTVSELVEKYRKMSKADKVKVQKQKSDHHNNIWDSVINHDYYF